MRLRPAQQREREAERSDRQQRGDDIRGREPVRFVGVGEQMTDLLELSPAEFVDSLLE